jgi:hypothetical protein
MGRGVTLHLGRLGQVLKSWPFIYSALNGTATLSVLYGFTPAFVKSLPAFFGSRANEWLEKMRGLLQLPGVRYVGLVDHDTLAREYASAGFILYPTSFPETGCFALMKVLGFVVHNIVWFCDSLGCAGHGDGCDSNNKPLQWVHCS